MVTVKDVYEQNQGMDCRVALQGEKVPFEDVSFGWSGPLDLVPEFLYDLPVEEIVLSEEDGFKKFYLYIPYNKLEAAYKEPDLPFSEDEEVME